MTIVITGATGNVGRPLTNLLLDAGASVRAITRNPATAGLPDDVELLTSTKDALRGASAVFLNSRALGGELVETVNIARAEGVGKLVALSAINADDDFSRQPSRFRGDRNKEVEQLATDSGLPWVSLRPSVFASNCIPLWAPQIQAGNVVYGPYAASSSAPIAEIDIAAVAAHALLTNALVGQKLPLTGPQALTNNELVALIGEVLGRPLRYQEIPAEAVQQQFIDTGLPTEMAEAYAALLAKTVDTPAEVTSAVENILGHPARTFADWAAENRAVFAS